MSWLIITKQGNRTELVDLFAYKQGLWLFMFFGDETYTDPYDSSVWTWEGVTNDVDEILVIIYKGVFLIRTESEADLLAQDGSFYWDDVNGILYVHWFDFGDDYYFGRSLGRLSQIVAGFANGYSDTSQNVYDSFFYDPTILDVSGLSKKADLTKLGLVTFDDSSITLTDQPNNLYTQTGEDSVGIPLWVYLVDKSDTVLTDEMRIFTGVYNGYKHSRAAMQYQIVETRFFQNMPVCPNSISVDDFADIGDLDGSLIPTAWGQIRRGKMILTNYEALSTAAGTAIFLVADPALGAILAVSNVYDEAGEVQAITMTNLTACLISVTKPVDIAPGDLKNWSWAGQGYDIDGTYNNGLDIIRAAYLLLANISYTTSTFDTFVWDAATLIEDSAIGISVQSEKGLVEEIIEPITTSLQGVVEILGDGRISWASRDTSEIPIIDIPIISAQDQLELPQIDVNPSEVVSELQVNYSPDAALNETLSKIYSENREDVVTKYSIDRRDPLSPVETVLADEADVDTLAAELMETSTDPTRYITTQTTDLLTNVRFFDIVGIDIGTFGNEFIEYGELLSIIPNYNEFTHDIRIRVIPDYSPLLYVQGQGFSNQLINTINDGMSDKGINQISNGFGVTDYI